MKAINPATEELIRDYPEHSPKEVRPGAVRVRYP